MAVKLAYPSPITMEMTRTPMGQHEGCGGLVSWVDSPTEVGRHCEKCGSWGPEIYLKGDHTLAIHGHPDRDRVLLGAVDVEITSPEMDPEPDLTYPEPEAKARG